MFGSFYHDSLDTFFKVVGEELLSMPIGQFEALANERQRKACSAIVDQATYRSVMFRGFILNLQGRARNTLTLKA